MSRGGRLQRQVRFNNFGDVPLFQRDACLRGKLLRVIMRNACRLVAELADKRGQRERREQTFHYWRLSANPLCQLRIVINVQSAQNAEAAAIETDDADDVRAVEPGQLHNMLGPGD